MKFDIRYIIPLLALWLLAACTGDVEVSVGTGSFSFGLLTDELPVELETRAARALTDEEAAVYTVTLCQGEETVWSKKLSEVTLPDCTQPLGADYVLSAESCTAAEAESANDGWGLRRMGGESAPFDIVADYTASVQVTCTMQNAGLCVVFDKSFTDYFSEYAVTTDDVRGLKFNAANAAELDDNHQLTRGAIAYYNTADDGRRTLTVIISASAGWDGTVRLTRTLTLQRGKVTRLRVHLGDQPMGSLSSVSVSYSDAFDESEEEIFLAD